MRLQSVPRKFAMRCTFPYLILGQNIVMLSDNMTFLHAAESDVKCHGRLKRYPDGSWELMAASRPIFGGDGWEQSDKSDSITSKPQTGKRNAADVERARRRACAAVRDIARCNRFAYFVTLTINPERANRYDAHALARRWRSWLDNRVRRRGLRYVLVPELHKDGAIHYHGFFSAHGCDFVPSGTYKLAGVKRPRKPRNERQRDEWIAACAKPVYNIADWDLGFSTAIEITGNYDAAVGYCCKYIGKSGEKIGGRWYYSGGDLVRPSVDFVDVDYWQVRQLDGAYAVDIPNAGMGIVILRGDDGVSFDGR